ncbi:MAG: cytochrome c biogenesis protein CcsA [Planctomycetota bacterium]
MGVSIAPAKEGYTDEQADGVVRAAIRLRTAWLDRDADAANSAIVELAVALQAVNPSVYPSETKRVGEVWYNRLFKLTLPGAALYFVAFALFLVAAYSETPRARLWGLRFFVLGFLVHTVGIGVRWWLVEKSTDDLFHAIPIKNQFESVMFSAWFGALVGLLLELRRRVGSGGLFGAAAAFVGWLSLIAIFAAPYVFGRDIGGEIGQASGILMSYWLYIHVTTVCASYALIGMNFLLSIWWLVAHLRGSGQLKHAATDVFIPGGIAIMLARVFFIPVKQPVNLAGAFSTEKQPRSMLDRLDSANLVVLQLAFWILGAGIVFGAVWADMSWGRPWGWDPKETFALVTWIVYLGILHVRLVTKRKAFWTAVLCVIGFFIMLFNWIGVNFFLVGLHSYA